MALRSGTCSVVVPPLPSGISSAIAPSLQRWSAKLASSGRPLMPAAKYVAAALLHHLERAPHHAGDAGVADEHVVRLFGQHELAGARQRIEAALGEALQLELAVAVGEIGEHEERQPVADRLVEGAEDARLVGIAGMARQQLLRLLAPVAAEIGVQQIDHRPEMAALLDIDLE